jgi:hypothetical protein
MEEDHCTTNFLFLSTAPSITAILIRSMNAG